MNSFRISIEQIVGVIGALIAEELKATAGRRIDFLTSASWRAEATLGGDALRLTAAEIAACADRVDAYFGCAAALGESAPETSLGDWARRVQSAIERSLTAIRFTPAGGVDQNALCEHPAENIFADAAAAANLLYGRRRVLSLVAPHSLLGLTLTVLTPNLQKIPAIDARSMAPEELRSTLQFGDALVATPTLWRYMLQQDVTAPDNAMGVYFGEPMTAELSADMRQAGFGAQREIYGSTETGLVGWRDAPTDPFILFDHWTRDADETALTRVNTDGAQKSVTPMDVLHWVDERRFTLAGRRDGALQIGAVNVFPERVAQAIIAHDLVDDCIIRGVRPTRGANRLIAHIVLNKAATPTESAAREIDQWCRKTLRPQERPSIFHFEKNLDALKASETSG